MSNLSVQQKTTSTFKSLLLVGLVWLILLLPVACSDTGNLKSKSPTLTKTVSSKVLSGSIGDASKLLPMMASDMSSGILSGLIFNGLVKYDNNLNLVGDLAEKFKVSDDCLKLEFQLKKGVKWHDGKELTTADLLFTYNKLIDPTVASPYKGDFELVDKFQVLDRYNVLITYKKPFAPAASSWSMGIIPAHLLKDADLNTTPYNRHPVGTGPYRFKSWETGSMVTLVANNNYFEKKPGIDQYIFRIIPDSATMFLELKAGNLDHMNLDPMQYTRQTDTPFFKKRFKKYNYPDFAYTYLGLNNNDPRFSNRDIRRAIAYAINKNSIIEGVLQGMGRAATGPFPPESWAYNNNVPVFEYNPDKSIALLNQAGWMDTDGDGYLDKKGNRFSFTILTNQGNSKRAKTAEIIQQDLKRVGIEVKVRIIEWQALLHQFIDKKKFDAIIMGWALGRDPDMYDIFHSSKTAEGEFNFVSYNNSKVDDLLVKGRRTCNKNKRKNLYHEIHKLIAEDLPYIFLFYPDKLPILEQRFKGVGTGPLGIWYNLTDWTVPKDKNMWYQ